MLSPSRLLRALLASALLLSLAGVSVASAYEDEVVAQITVTGPSGTIKCNTQLIVHATLRDVEGKLIADHRVFWSIVLKLATGDRILPASSLTNGSGVASATVRLACFAGPRTVRAGADAAVGTLVLRLTNAGLPRTSTAMDPAASETTPVWLLVLAAVAVTGDAAFATRRRQARISR